MRAVRRHRYGPPEVLAVEDVGRPHPDGDEILVEVAAASLNTADLDHLRGAPALARVATGLRRPRTPGVGLDVAGRVVATGPEATRFRTGDRVWADLFEFGHGALAELVCAPERAFTPMPADLDFETAATVPHSGLLAFQALAARGPIRPGDEVLVNGAGGCVGPFAVQIAAARGAVVTGVDHTDKLDVVGKAGADRVVDYTVEDPLRHRGRYDLVVDIAESHGVRDFRRALKPGGRHVLVARTLGGFVEAALVGGVMSVLGRERMGTFRWVPNRSGDLDEMGRLIASGQVRPVVDRRYTLEEAPAAFRRLADGRARGKLLVVPGPEA